VYRVKDEKTEALRRKKISETLKKRFAEKGHWATGRKKSQEECKAISENHRLLGVNKGIRNPMYGRKGKESPRYGKENKWGKHTPETRQKQANAWHDTHKIRTGKAAANWQGGPITVDCDKCRKPKIIKRSRPRQYRHHFCTRECQRQWMAGRFAGPKSAQWLGGISRLPYSFNFNKELKALIRKRDGFICQGCGKTEEGNGRALSVHHIDYDKLNSEPKNLIALCIRCNVRANNRRPFWQEHYSRKMRIA